MKDSLLYWIGTFFLALGLLIAFLPHAAHSSVGLGKESHTKDILQGIIYLVTGLVIMILSKRIK